MIRNNPHQATCPMCKTDNRYVGNINTVQECGKCGYGFFVEDNSASRNIIALLKKKINNRMQGVRGGGITIKMSDAQKIIQLLEESK